MPLGDYDVVFWQRMKEAGQLTYDVNSDTYRNRAGDTISAKYLAQSLAAREKQQAVWEREQALLKLPYLLRKAILATDDETRRENLMAYAKQKLHLREDLKIERLKGRVLMVAFYWGVGIVALSGVLFTMELFRFLIARVLV